jgi:hypothetical protein
MIAYVPRLLYDGHFMTKQLQLPLGISDFKDLRSAENRDRIYLVDKTPLIDAIMEEASATLLITRPIRFMKTTNLSMLRYFFDIEAANENQGLFDDFAIKTNPQYQQTWQRHQGKYPVIYLSFKDVRGSNWDALHFQLIDQIQNTYEQHKVLENSTALSATDKERYTALVDKRAFNLPEVANLPKERQEEAFYALYRNALVTLITNLHQHYQQKVIVLIDEYDTPLHSAYQNTPEKYRNLSIGQVRSLPKEEQGDCYFQETVEWMTKFLGPALKDNRYVRKAVMTGVLRTAFASLISSLNNVSIHSVLSQEYAQYFGITHPELAIMLDRLGIREQLDIVKEKIESWYNGYEVGCGLHGSQGTLLFNPWSIATYLSRYQKFPQHHLEPQGYWLETSNSRVIGDYGRKFYLAIEKDLVQLIQKKTILVDLDERTVFNDLDLHDLSAFWGLLVHTGYLTVKRMAYLDDGRFSCTVAIPNEEVWTAYTSFTRRWFQRASASQHLEFTHVLDSFLTGNLDYFKAYLQNYMLGVVSYFDIPKKMNVPQGEQDNDLIVTPEQIYHMFLLGFLAGLHGTHYYMQSNRESGHGRYDLLLLPKNSQQHSVLFEFKVAQKREQLEQYASNALWQIRDKAYHTESVSRGISKGLHLGVSFCGKYVHLEHEWWTY